jgi:hypothetical protein
LKSLIWFEERWNLAKKGQVNWKSYAIQGNFAMKKTHLFFSTILSVYFSSAGHSAWAEKILTLKICPDGELKEAKIDGTAVGFVGDDQVSNLDSVKHTGIAASMKGGNVGEISFFYRNELLHYSFKYDLTNCTIEFKPTEENTEAGRVTRRLGLKIEAEGSKSK